LLEGEFGIISDSPLIFLFLKCMKKYPSVWITKQLDQKANVKWDISVKLRADMNAFHFTKNSKEEAIALCKEYYGGYDSIIELF